MPCFHIYNTIKCHFKPNQKCQQDMNDPVVCLEYVKLQVNHHLALFCAVYCLKCQKSTYKEQDLRKRSFIFLEEI